MARFLAVPLGTAKGRIRLALEKLYQPLAALVALLIAGVGLSSYRWHEHRSAFRRDEAALAMLTGSHMEALRLVPPAARGEVESGPHATYRAERGGAIAVFTLSRVAAPPAGAIHRLWGLSGGAWRVIGEPAADAQGHARLILEPPGGFWPEALKLTLEPKDSVSPAPGGVLVLEWRSPE